MKYRIFSANDEKEINNFLEENKDKIGKESYWTEPKSGNLCFLFNDKFDPEFVAQIQKRSFWQETHQKKCKELADMVWKIALWKQLPGDAVVGEEELGGAIAGRVAKAKITAQTAIERTEIEVANWEKQIEILGKLLQA